jgi:hypothetical protein
VLEISAELGYTVEVCPLPFDEFMRSDEVFITSTREEHVEALSSSVFGVIHTDFTPIHTTDFTPIPHKLILSGGSVVDRFRWDTNYSIYAYHLLSLV